MSQILDITTSREELRQKLLDEYAKILLVNSEDLDQSDSAFNTYVLNALSYALADALYFGSIVYRESTLITANLPDTILNWATYLDYTPRKAKPAEVNLLIEMPIEEAFTATIPEGHEFTATNGLIFRSKYKVDINVSPTGSKKVEILTDTGLYALPIDVSSVDNKPIMSFLIPAVQYDTIKQDFTVPSLQPFEFFYKMLNLSSNDDNILDVEVYIDGELWTQKKLVLLHPNEKGYEAIIHKNSIELLFGNGFFGKQPSGHVEVYIKTTKGKIGNIIPGTITQGKEFLSNFNVKYNVINTEAATGGEDFESIDSIRRNAINSLKMINRLVSNEDYHNISSILGLSETIVSKPILKRSDLTCNDINLYIVLNFNNKIVPTNTIPIDVSPTQLNYRPLSVFNYDGKTWICPFSISLDFNTKIATFYYIKPRDIFSVTRIYENNSNHLISKVESRYNPNTDNIEFYVYIITYDVPGITFSQTMELMTSSSSTLYNPDSTDILDYNIIKFTYNIPRVNTYGVKTLLINTYEDNGSGAVLRTQYKTNVELNFELKEITYSHIIEYPVAGQYKCLDIPVFDKDYWDTLTQDEKDKLQIQSIENIIKQVNSFGTRILNTHVSGKFAKTLGTTENTKFSTGDYMVVGIYNDSASLPPANANPGAYFALSNITDHTDPFYEFSGHLVVSDGANYHGIRIGRGTIVYNLNDNLIYASDGRRWIIPNYKLPLEFLIELHVGFLNLQIIEDAKDIVLEHVNSLGIEGSLYLSNIIDKLHNLDNVRYCRIIKPETDIIYRDIVENLKQEDLYFYVPEYIFTEKDLITIQPISEN